jgi:hypothetical protein
MSGGDIIVTCCKDTHYLQAGANRRAKSCVITESKADFSFTTGQLKKFYQRNCSGQAPLAGANFYLFISLPTYQD